MDHLAGSQEVWRGWQGVLMKDPLPFCSTTAQKALGSLNHGNICVTAIRTKLVDFYSVVHPRETFPISSPQLHMF